MYCFIVTLCTQARRFKLSVLVSMSNIHSTALSDLLCLEMVWNHPKTKFLLGSSIPATHEYRYLALLIFMLVRVVKDLQWSDN